MMFLIVSHPQKIHGLYIYIYNLYIVQFVADFPADQEIMASMSIFSAIYFE